MKRYFQLTVVAASFVLVAGVGSAGAGTHPDDRANHGVGALSTESSSDRVLRPDDRAWRGVGPAPAPERWLGVGTSGLVHPDDRAVHGTGAISRVSSEQVLRPDDRAWRGVGTEPVLVPVSAPSVQADTFDWFDAGIGAAAAFGLGLLLAGASAILLRRQRVVLS